MSAWLASRVTGWGSTWTRSAGRPVLSNSARAKATTRAVVDQPAGEGAMITALRPLSAIIALLMGVAAGLVEGVIAATTPTGLA